MLLGTQTQFSNGDDLSLAEAVPIDFTGAQRLLNELSPASSLSRRPHRDGNIIPEAAIRVLDGIGDLGRDGRGLDLLVCGPAVSL